MQVFPSILVRVLSRWVASALVIWVGILSSAQPVTAAELAHSLGGVIVYDQSGLGAEHAVVVPYTSYEEFSQTLTIVQPSTQERRLFRHQVIALIPFPNLQSNRTSELDFKDLQDEVAKMREVSKASPNAREVLEPLITEAEAFLTERDADMHFVGGKWVEAGSYGPPKPLIIRTLSGKVYRNVSIQRLRPESIRIIHGTGVANIPVKDLSASELNKLRYDPDRFLVTRKEPVKEEWSLPVDTSWKPTSIQDVERCVVLIETDSGTGSGFLCHHGKHTYIYTNAHVVAAAKDMKMRDKNGTRYTDVLWLEAAAEGFANGDLVRFRLKKPRAHALRMTLDPEAVETGQKVHAIGNSEGTGVIVSIAGEINGVGPDKLEISANIVSGNSGGPIVDAETFEVIGVSTYLTRSREDIWTEGTEFDKVRRFGLRPNQVQSWETYSPEVFANQGHYINLLFDNVLSMMLLQYFEYGTNGVYFNRHLNMEGRWKLGDLLDLQAHNPVIKGLFDLDASLKTTSQFSRSAIISQYTTFLGGALQDVKDQRVAASKNDWAWFFQSTVDDTKLIDVHKELERDLEKFIKSL